MDKMREELHLKMKNYGITMFSNAKKADRASSAANTYLFSDKNNQYVLDPAFGAVRREEILKTLGKSRHFNILCTHYHNDHSANNGQIACKNSLIYYHHNIKEKIQYFRTNGTGQVVAMGKDLDLRGLLKRFRMFPDWLISSILLSSKISGLFPAAFLFLVSYAYSWKHIGKIDPGRKRAKFLEPADSRTLKMSALEITGWQIDKHLVAIDAQGHTNDHLIYFLTDRKVLFTGDALNFLNGNDVQFGDINKVDETIDFILQFTEKEKVEILLQGHYYPITGTGNILKYIRDVRDKHKEMFNITCSVLQLMEEPVRFDKALENLYSHPAELVQGLARIAFPRSTLVFLDVYLLKVMKSLGYTRQKTGTWKKTKPLSCQEQHFPDDKQVSLQLTAAELTKQHDHDTGAALKDLTHD